MKIKTQIRSYSGESLDFDSLFEGRLDYRENPLLLDIAQETENEKLMFYESVKYAKHIFKNIKDIVIIDLCTGSGMFADKIAKELSVKKLYCVDNDISFLNKAMNCLNKYDFKKDFLCEDATYYNCPEKADLILMGSAYHHIEDNLKEQFLYSAKNNLKPDGIILVNENFLPSYKKDKLFSYQEAIYIFYSELIEWLRNINTSEGAINILRQTAWYGFHREYEYKVSKKIFTKNITNTGLLKTKEIQVWGKNSNLNNELGSYVSVLKNK